MSEIELATRYAAENYPIALKNLAKRYQKNGDGEPIHYSELGFGGISDDQAKSALRFFADVGLVENPKGANYIPPESLIDWQLKMGATSDEGKKQIRDGLLEYDVFDEAVFILEDGGEKLTSLAEQVGGIVGIDEDELADMEKTIEVIAECGFMDISEDGIVTLVDNIESGAPSENSENTSPEHSNNPSNSEDNESEASHQIQDAPKQTVRSTPVTAKNKRRALTADLDITLDATDMEPKDLKEKLEIIEGIIGHDGE